jgi:hypothetical protein
MANEIQYSAMLQAAKNGASIGQQLTGVCDMAGAQMTQKTQNIGTTAEAISFDDISGAPKLVLLQNLDPTNYVEIDSASTMDKFPQKLLPGPSAGIPGTFILLAPETGTIYAKAHTAAVNLLVLAVEA